MWGPLRLLRKGEKLKDHRTPEQRESWRQRAAVLLDAGWSLRSAAVTDEWTAAAGGVALVAGSGATSAVAEAAAAPAGMETAAGPLVSAPAASVLPGLRSLRGLGSPRLHGRVGNRDPAPGELDPAP